MASCSVPNKRARRTPAASNAGVLPADVLYDVLLRLPAKELCRLRAVCRSWRSLTSDQLFIKAHTACHPGPLFLTSFRDDKAHICITDLSGNVVKRIGNADGHKVLCTRLSLVCVATKRNSCHVLNPATGAVYVLPESPAEEHVNHTNLCEPYTSFAFGRVTSTGEYKVLRMFNRPEWAAPEMQQLFEVFTISGATGHARWQRKQCRELLVHIDKVNSGVVVDGVVYFLMDSVYIYMMIGGVNTGIHPDCIASFDLETEEWREDLQGPISSSCHDHTQYLSIWFESSLAELKGYLVLVYYRQYHSTMELWFLTDFENGIWVKEYSIQTESVIPANEKYVKPLLVLDDGRIVIRLGLTGLLLIYDPRTSTFTEVEMRHLAAVGLYTGSLLSLQNGDMV